MTQAEAIALLDPVVERLGEHFDAVQILVSWNEEGNTMALPRGGGNWYARQGMAQEFVDNAKARDSAHYIKEALEDE